MLFGHFKIDSINDKVNQKILQRHVVSISLTKLTITVELELGKVVSSQFNIQDDLSRIFKRLPSQNGDLSPGELKSIQVDIQTDLNLEWYLMLKPGYFISFYLFDILIVFHVCLENQKLILDVLLFRRIALAKFPEENGFPGVDGYITVPFFVDSEISNLSKHGRSALSGDAMNKQSLQKHFLSKQKVMFI
jgi:hypothetical protein